MYTQNLENNTRFEAGRTYYYHFSCNYDSLSFMQIVSVSDTRKTAVIQKLIGGKPHGEPTRKKIHVWGGVEHISAGNYSMAGSWSADEWDKSELLKALDLDFMHEHESADAWEVLPEMPAAAPAGTVYTVNVDFYADKCVKEAHVSELLGVSLADFVKYIDNNANLIADAIGAHWGISYRLYKNGKIIDNGFTRNFRADMLESIMAYEPDEYPAILAAISEPDNDPDPTEPTDKPDYSAFDAAFKSTKIISISFGGASCSATAPVKRKKLTEKEWKKQLEAKAAFEAAEKEAERAEIERRFNALQVGDKLSNGETVTKISIEENYIEGTFTEIWTESTDIEWAYCYYLENFLDGDISFAEIPEPEEIDENQITFDEIAAYSANDTAALTVPTSPIDETAAKQGHEAYCTSDYKAGSATAEYNAAVADVKAAADEVRGRIPEEYHVELDRLVNRYAAKLADWTNRKNRVDASCPSWFITGAANYPHKKHEKQMQRLDKLFKEYDTITALENRIKNFAFECKHRPIKAGDASAVEKLRAKVEELTALQNKMKQDNAEARRQGKTAPYGAYSLSNNRQNLKRYADRLTAIEKAKSAPIETADHIEGEGFRVVRNTEIMRLQFLFDGKPDERTRTILKSNGFKWAPSQKAWQRQLTANAERAARTVVNSIQ